MPSITVRVVLATALVCGVTAPLRAGDAARAFEPAVARRITPEEVQQRRKAGEKPIILDTRMSAGDTVVHGAVRVPNDQLEAWAKNVPKKTLIVAYCT